MGNCHRAITLTGGMCAAVAARIPGSLAHDLMDSGAQVRIGNPSGVLPVDAEVRPGADGPHAIRATTYRTQRRLMEGWITLPSDAPDVIA